MKTLTPERASGRKPAHSTEGLFELLTSADIDVEMIAESMARVNMALRPYAKNPPTQPLKILSLSRLIRREDSVQRSLVESIREKQRKINEEWNVARLSGDRQSEDNLEALDLKMAMLDYDLKCRAEGMRAALAFPKKCALEIRKDAKLKYGRSKRVLSFLWKTDVGLAAAVLLASLFTGRPEMFWAMISAGIFLMLAGTAITLADRKSPGTIRP
jgi:hypothetical protein